MILQPGESSQTVEIDLLYSATSEQQESFTVNLHNPQGLDIADDSVTVSVNDSEFEIYFAETFSGELAKWEVTPSATAPQTLPWGEIATFEYVDSEWASEGYWGSQNGLEVPSFYSSDNGYALYYSGFYRGSSYDGSASQYSTMQTLESISVDEDIPIAFEFESYYAWYTYYLHDASVYVAIKDAEVDLFG